MAVDGIDYGVAPETEEMAPLLDSAQVAAAPVREVNPVRGTAQNGGLTKCAGLPVQPGRSKWGLRYCQD